VLNKCDLISKEQQEEWIHWFNENYPDLYVMTFMCYSNKYGEDEKKQKRKKKEVDRDNVYKVWEMCKKVYIERMKKPNADKYWDDLIDRAKKQLGPYDPQKEGSVEDIKDTITVGLIGHPNVGKSCFLNSLVGKTVVSVSLTPGHTKHFQTIFVSRYIRLCDSPGLVFPCIDMPKPLQV
jgi:ribosome biogenesis GTPase A